MAELTVEVLRDSKHAACLKTGLLKLYEEQVLCDVTLACSDGVELKAHWLVLSAHSDFLKHLAVSQSVIQFMLTESGSLKLNIESSTLKTILNYLYSGELVVTSRSLDKVKQAAKVLQLSQAIALLETSRLAGLGDHGLDAETKVVGSTTDIIYQPGESESLQPEIVSVTSLSQDQDQSFPVLESGHPEDTTTDQPPGHHHSTTIPQSRSEPEQDRDTGPEVAVLSSQIPNQSDVQENMVNGRDDAFTNVSERRYSIESNSSAMIVNQSDVIYTVPGHRHSSHGPIQTERNVHSDQAYPPGFDPPQGCGYGRPVGRQNPFPGQVSAGKERTAAGLNPVDSCPALETRVNSARTRGIAEGSVYQLPRTPQAENTATSAGHLLSPTSRYVRSPPPIKHVDTYLVYAGSDRSVAIEKSPSMKLEPLLLQGSPRRHKSSVPSESGTSCQGTVTTSTSSGRAQQPSDDNHVVNSFVNLSNVSNRNFSQLIGQDFQRNQKRGRGRCRGRGRGRGSRNNSLPSVVECSEIVRKTRSSLPLPQGWAMQQFIDNRPNLPLSTMEADSVQTSQVRNFKSDSMQTRTNKHSSRNENLLASSDTQPCTSSSLENPQEVDLNIVKTEPMEYIDHNENPKGYGATFSYSPESLAVGQVDVNHAAACSEDIDADYLVYQNTNSADESDSTEATSMPVVKKRRRRRKNRLRYSQIKRKPAFRRIPLTNGGGILKKGRKKREWLPAYSVVSERAETRTTMSAELNLEHVDNSQAAKLQNDDDIVDLPIHIMPTNAPQHSYLESERVDDSWMTASPEDCYFKGKNLDIPREFPCDLCGKRYTTASSVRRHQHIKHSAFPFVEVEADVAEEEDSEVILAETGCTEKGVVMKKKRAKKHHCHCGKPFYHNKKMMKHSSVCRKYTAVSRLKWRNFMKQLPSVTAEKPEEDQGLPGQSSDAGIVGRVKRRRRRFRCYCGKRFIHKKNWILHTAGCARKRGNFQTDLQTASTVKVRKRNTVEPLPTVNLYISGTTCSVCEKTYTRVDTLKQHIRATHFNEKPYKCVCNMTFGWSNEATIHRRTCSVHLEHCNSATE